MRRLTRLRAAPCRRPDFPLRRGIFALTARDEERHWTRPVSRRILRQPPLPESAMLPSAEVFCPYCGEPIELIIDDSAGDQRYIEDCQVCCRPIVVAVSLDEDGEPRVDVFGEDEA